MNDVQRRIGFGCARLRGGISKAFSLKLLDHAYACGIRHYDTAPLYGLGAADNVLATFLKNKRHTVTLATKIGISRPRYSNLLSVARVCSKIFVDKIPLLKSLALKKLSTLSRKDVFNIFDVVRSLEESLLIIGVDYIDYLMLHDPPYIDTVSNDMFHLLECLRLQNVVKYYGIGSDKSIIKDIRGVKALQMRWSKQIYSCKFEDKDIFVHGIIRHGASDVEDACLHDMTIREQIFDEFGQVGDEHFLYVLVSMLIFFKKTSYRALISSSSVEHIDRLLNALCLYYSSSDDIIDKLYNVMYGLGVER